MFFPLNIIPRIFCLTGNDILKYIYTIQWNMISYIYIYIYIYILSYLANQMWPK